MERKTKKSKKKSTKEKPPQPRPVENDTKKTPEGIPDVDFKKFLGCG